MDRLIRCAAVLAAALMLPGFTWTAVEFDNVKVQNDTAPLRIPAQITKPDGDGKFPAVILWHTCGRPTSAEFQRTWPDFFLRMGYVVMLIDSLTPRGLTSCPTLLQPPTRRQPPGDAYGALRYLSTLPYVDAQRVALMGFSFGAVMIASMSNTDYRTPEGLQFKAFVSFYGSCSQVGRNQPPVYRGRDPSVPWLIVRGQNELQPWRGEGASNVDFCAEVAKRRNVAFHILPHAAHGWDQEKHVKPVKDEFGTVIQYNHDATEQSRKLVREFLTAQFAK